MRKNSVLLLSAVALAFMVSMIPDAAHGTVLVQKDLEDLVYESTDIIVGTVVKADAAWNSDETRIYTHVVLNVETAVKGDFESGEKVRFKTIGGTVEEIRLEVPSSPQFNVDEKVCVFFGGDANYNTPITGWEQGKYTVENGIILENGRYLDDVIDEINALMTRTEQ
jgi:hypothetical protein